MNSLFKKDKKDESKDPKDLEAKKGALLKLREMAMGEIKQGLSSPGAKKVSVMSDSKEGLEKGLDKAKSLVGGEESSEDEEGAAHEALESPEMEASEHEGSCPHCGEDHSEDLSSEEIDELISHLQELKAKKQSPLA